MAPLVRRSWHPRGRTPILYQRTRSYQKVSVIAALCVHPERDWVQLYFRFHLNANINALGVRAFLSQLHDHLQAPSILIWDRLLAHRAKIVREWLSTHPNFHSIFLPAYAPELNPVEYLWAYLKHNPLANAVYFDVDTLAQQARSHARSVQLQQGLLRSFILHSPLSLRLK